MVCLRLLFKVSLLVFAVNVLAFTQGFSDMGHGNRIVYDTSIRGGNGPVDPGDRETAGNVVRRMVRDRGQPFLGFEVHVDPASSDDFIVSWEPMEGWPFFVEKPGPRRVHAGQWLALDPFEQPSTGAEILDRLVVSTRETPAWLLPLPEDLPQIPTGTFTIRLDHPTVTQGQSRLGESVSLVAGTVVGFKGLDAGQATFSSQPAPGFRMEAVAEGRFLSFISKQNVYEIVCDTPITNLAGAWYLWVNYESPKAKPDAVAKDNATLSFELFTR